MGHVTTGKATMPIVLKCPARCNIHTRYTSKELTDLSFRFQVRKRTCLEGLFPHKRTEDIGMVIKLFGSTFQADHLAGNFGVFLPMALDSTSDSRLWNDREASSIAIPVSMS